MVCGHTFYKTHAEEDTLDFEIRGSLRVKVSANANDVLVFFGGLVENEKVATEEALIDLQLQAVTHEKRATARDEQEAARSSKEQHVEILLRN